MAMVFCFTQVAQVFAKSLMDACAKHVVPPLQIFVDNILQRCGLITGPVNNLMILASDLIIHDPENKHREWIDLDDTRFEKAAVLTQGSHSWEIKAVINFDSLSAEKTYVVYLIFNTTRNPAGLDAILTAMVSTEIGDETKDVCLSLEPKADADQKSHDIKMPVKSSDDKWMELELGEFLCSNIDAERVAKISIKVKESGKHNMMGVYVAGIELRSKSY